MENFLSLVNQAMTPTADKYRYVEQIYEMQKNEPNQYLNYTIEILNTRDQFSPLLIQFVLITLGRMFPQKMIHSTQNIFEILDPEEVQSCIDILFKIMESQDSNLETIACMVFSKIAVSNENFGQHYQIASFITQAFLDPKPDNFAANLLEIFADILGETEIPFNNVEIVINGLFEHLNTGKYEINNRLASAIQKFIEGIISTYDDIIVEEDMLTPLLHILNIATQVPEAAAAGYMNWIEIVNVFYSDLGEIIDSLISETIEKMSNEELDPNTRGTICLLWKAIGDRERKEETTFNAIGNNAKDIINLLFQTASHIESPVVTKDDINQPFIEATRTLHGLAKLIYLHPIMIQVMMKHMESSVFGEREAALSVFAVLCKTADVSSFFQAGLEFTQNMLSDKAPRVRENAIMVIRILLRIFIDEKPVPIRKNQAEVISWLLEMAESIAQLMEMDQIVSHTAGVCLVDYLNLPEFEQREDILVRVLEAVQIDDIDVALSALDSLCSAIQNASADVINALLNPLLEIFEAQIKADDHNEKMLGKTLEALLLIFRKEPENIREKASEIWDAFALAFEQIPIMKVEMIPPLTAFARSIGEDFNEMLDDTLGFIIEEFNNTNNDQDVLSIVIALKQLFDAFDISERVPEIINRSSALIKEVTTNGAKAALIGLVAISINVLPEAFVDDSETVLNFLIDALNEAESNRKELIPKKNINEVESELELLVGALLKALTGTTTVLYQIKSDLLPNSLGALLDAIEAAGSFQITQTSLIEEFIDASFFVADSFDEEAKQSFSESNCFLNALQAAIASGIEAEKVGALLGFIHCA